MKHILILAVAATLLTIAPVVGADDLAGVSGQCYASDGSGGEDHIAVTDEPGADGMLDPVPGDGGLTDALATFAAGSAENDPGSACTAEDCSQEEFDNGACDKVREDYLEVHAAGNQVCYNGEVTTDGSCATRPTGPP